MRPMEKKVILILKKSLRGGGGATENPKIYTTFWIFF